MTMTVADIGSALLSLDNDASHSEVTPLIEGQGHEWSLLSVSPGETWSKGSETSPLFQLLVLEGFATCADAAGRQSVGSGHLVVFNSEGSLTITNQYSKPKPKSHNSLTTP